MVRALLILAAAASLAGSAQAQQQPKQPQTVRCIKDSFGNYTCTDGTWASTFATNRARI